jgi:copper homeostasis protein
MIKKLFCRIIIKDLAEGQVMAKTQNPLLEICVDSVESAIAAQTGGADRVELYANRNEDGTTPSAGMIAAARKNLSIGLQVLIRPRSGDFCYSDLEFAAMKKDSSAELFAAVRGVVDPQKVKELRQYMRIH